MNLFDLAVMIVAPLVTILIYGAGASFPGWTFWEVLLIQALFELSAAINAVLFESIIWATMGHVSEGSLETVLLKPMSPILFLLSSNFSTSSFGGIVGGLTLTIIAALNCDIHAVQIPLCILVFAAGLCVSASASFIIAAASFKWVANSRLGEIRTTFGRFGSYPAGIFPKALRIAITFVIPYAAMGFLPAEILLGRFDPINLFVLIPAAVFMCFAVWLYNHMIKLYEGVGG
jgi:ABC-2 type transport system permease protein